MKILLVCYGGLSTSMLVNKMIKAVDDSPNLRDKKIVIEAWGKEEYYEKLDDTKIIMLGPQVSMIKEEVTKVALDKGYDVPVIVIDKEQYGGMEAVPVLLAAFDAIKAHKKR
ncbi:MAG: PTS sugar transporter subunit IIB [Longicatena sp.]